MGLRGDFALVDIREPETGIEVMSETFRRRAEGEGQVVEGGGGQERDLRIENTQWVVVGKMIGRL